jgi:hypothetical protein
MAKYTHDDVMDAAANYIKNNCTRVTLCDGQPTTYTEANATFALADVTVSGTDFTVANGTTSGRKVTFAGKTGVTVDANGDGDHVAYLDVANSKLLHVTTVSSPQTVYAGNTCNIGSQEIEFGDPT